MAMHRNVCRAERTINNMPLKLWVNVRELAKNADLSIHTMSRFLVRARRVGKVENKRVTVHLGRAHLWRRLK